MRLPTSKVKMNDFRTFFLHAIARPFGAIPFGKYQKRVDFSYTLRQANNVTSKMSPFSILAYCTMRDFHDFGLT